MSGHENGTMVRERWPPHESVGVVVHESFCAHLAGKMYLERMLFLSGSASCEQLRSTLRHASDVWNVYLKDIQMHVTSYRGYMNRFVNVSARNFREEDNRFLGFASFPEPSTVPVPSDVSVNSNHCYYMHFALCDLLRKWHEPALLCSTVLAFTACLLVIMFVTRSTMRLVLLLYMLVPVPLQIVTSILICSQCEDFYGVLVHEMGHALGLLHTDECVNTDGSVSVMFSRAQHKRQHTLTPCDLMELAAVYPIDTRNPNPRTFAGWEVFPILTLNVGVGAMLILCVLIAQAARRKNGAHHWTRLPLVAYRL